MVAVRKNTKDTTSKLVKQGADRIITDFNNGGDPCHKKWVQLYANDYRSYPSESITNAMQKIANAGFYVWKIWGYFGRNCNCDTVYRITESKVRPTPGCSLVFTP